VGPAPLNAWRRHEDTERSTGTEGGHKAKGESEFNLCIERVLQGIDRRTTLMIRNIPNKYSQISVIDEICQECQEDYDFFYLPIGNKSNISCIS